uniref:SH3 domain-containing RING finger protein 3 n=1 Tax=Phallusia mammillata TaxID=59560 RepID=A0A6F9DSQ6_9ASCI|nr:SH3 domain-containing RING finger protein 3 [Phallusia mammillata]
MNSYFLNDILECSVCFKPLDESNKVLPCQHTFCKACLSAIVRTQKELRCPECRVVVKQRVEDLPSNILLIRLLDGIKFQQDQIKSHSEKHTRRHSVEGILSEPVPASGGAKDGGAKQTKQNEKSQERARSARVQNERPSSEVQVVPRPHACALFTYKSDQQSDLSFVKDDIVYLLKKIDNNWMSGECNGRMGVFPINYVKVIVPLPTEQPLCVALYDFESKNEGRDRDCLTFNKNEKIVAIRRVDENWAEGVCKDKIGIFPLSFVKLNDEAKKLLDIKDQVPGESNDNIRPNPQRSVSGGAAARRIISNKQGQKQTKKRHSFPTFHAAKAKENEPTTSHRHSMEILDTASSSVVVPTNNSSIMATTSLSAPSTTPVSSALNAGELVVRLRQKRPKEISVPPTVTPNEPSKLPVLCKMDPTKLPAAKSSSEGPRQSRNENTSSTDRPKPADQQTPRMSTPTRHLQSVKMVTAVYHYEAVKPDELELIKGNSYQLTEVCNDGWCRGRHIISGKVGVFPGNYVKPLTSVPVTRTSPVASRSSSGSVSSSSSSSSSPSQPTRHTRNSGSSNHQQNNVGQQRPSSSSAANRRTPPPRPVAPTSHASNQPSTSKPSTSSASGSSTSTPRLHIPSGKSGSGRKNVDKDKKREKGQLFLKMISGGGTKKTKSPTTPTSPTPRNNDNPLPPNSPSTSQVKPTLKPLMRDKYKAMMNFPANTPDELELKEGDIVIVHHRRPGGWFRGTHQKNGRSGHFPSTFVERLPNQ